MKNLYKYFVSNKQKVLYLNIEYQIFIIIIIMMNNNNNNNIFYICNEKELFGFSHFTSLVLLLTQFHLAVY